MIPGLGRKKRSLDALEDDVTIETEGEPAAAAAAAAVEEETDTEESRKRRSLDEILDVEMTAEEVSSRFKRQVGRKVPHVGSCDV